MPVGVQQVVKCAVAMCAIENKQFKIAQDFLDSVITDKLTDDPVSDFSNIAKSNKGAVQGILDKALEESSQKPKCRFWRRS